MASLKPSAVPKQAMPAVGMTSHAMVDPMTAGLGNTVAAELRPMHPVEAIEANAPAQEAALTKHALDATFGSHAFLRTQFEAAVFSQYHRLPGLPSSFVALDTLSGADESISFADYLGDARDPVEAPNLRAQAEALYGIRMPAER
ncbi:proteasome maturation protein [Thecamonas trahens ATCC 50062]|uniref:Proteasome maturation protein n=1 Tax=Thecamonas trahens ATCC 50062 TaxID=461836 RepID=A0A0L0DPP3_THETB|nr:proteasome maturation protein [Thecamonas trahens ATCC 50062]KNC53398.1 proteasome maturation protein [Thecamonas trahens ATCC 50062]|eukprot:XP_013754438.1 proteasome maturation protein [Thecamonas trahens ATCC 50062]